MVTKRVKPFLLNACPRCGGTLIRKDAADGTYFACFQCGKPIG